MSIKTLIEEAVAAGRAVPHVIAELFHHLEERIEALEKDAAIVPPDVVAYEPFKPLWERPHLDVNPALGSPGVVIPTGATIGAEAPALPSVAPPPPASPPQPTAAAIPAPEAAAPPPPDAPSPGAA